MACLLEDHEDVPAAVGGLVAAHGALQAVAGHRLRIQFPEVCLHPVPILRGLKHLHSTIMAGSYSSQYYSPALALHITMKHD